MEKNKTDIANFENIVLDYQAMVFRTAMGFVHSKEDAEDLTQEVFLKAYNSWSNFRGESEVSTWLYRITVNLCLNHLEKKSKRNIFQLTEEALRNLFNTKSDTKNPQQELEAHEQDDIIRQAIDSLPDKQRVAFVLSKYDDLSQKEVAAIMEISEGAVEQLLQRAKVNLQKKLEQTIGKKNR